MRGNRISIRKDRRGFTGLEAAIVLTAFIVVAAVFSYVVLNAGFFTTQTSKEVIHTGVEQATSSAELAGNVYGHGWAFNTSAAIYNITLGSYDNSTGIFTDGVTVGFDSETLSAHLTGLSNSSASWYYNVSVTYTNASGSTTNTTYFNFTNTNCPTGTGYLTNTLTTGVYDVTSIAYEDSKNVTDGGTIEVVAPGGSYYNESASGTDKHDADTTNLTVVEFYLQLTAGEHPMDLDGVFLAYTDPDTHVGNLIYTNNSHADEGNLSMGYWNYTIVQGDSDNLLETGEQAAIIVALPDYGVTANEEFTIEIRPPVGATLGITRSAPAAIDKVMNLH